MILLLLLLPLIGWAQDFSQRSFTAGARSSYFTETSDWDNSFLYYVPEYAEETFGEAIGQRRKLKLRVFDYVSSDEHVIIDPLDVSVEFFSNNNSFQIGFLRYRFSETFGLQLLDVANPRDYSEFVFNDLSWSKRAVFGLNDTYKWNALQIQMILTLWPNGDRLPYKHSAFDPTQGQFDYQGGVVDRPWFKDLEYGTRFKYLFANGLDFSFLYYHHFSRPTLLDVSVTNFTQVHTETTGHLVDSLGSSASLVLEDWVLRMDGLFTFNDLVQKGPLLHEKENHFQILAGIDRTLDNFLLGLQVQSDFTTQRHFYGLRSEYTNVSWWRPSVMFFKSYESQDQWFQLKSSFESDDWRLSVSYDNIHGSKKENEFFGFYRNLDRLLVDVSFTY